MHEYLNALSPIRVYQMREADTRSIANFQMLAACMIQLNMDVYLYQHMVLLVDVTSDNIKYSFLVKQAESTEWVDMNHIPEECKDYRALYKKFKIVIPEVIHSFDCQEETEFICVLLDFSENDMWFYFYMSSKGEAVRKCFRNTLAIDTSNQIIKKSYFSKDDEIDEVIYNITKLNKNYYGKIENLKSAIEVYEKQIKMFPNIKMERSEISLEQVTEVEKAMGVIFSDELREWFTYIGNIEKNFVGYLMGLEILSINEMFEVWKEWREFDNDSELNESILYTSFPQDAIQLRYCHPQWIPIAHDFSGNYIGVDLVPYNMGRYGQVINFGRDEYHKVVFADTLCTFLEFLIANQNDMVMMRIGSEKIYINKENINPIDWMKSQVL